MAYTDDFGCVWKTTGDGIAGTAAKEQSGFAEGGLRHGHTFLQLCDIRGYQNLIYDMMDEESRLWKLIEMLEDFKQEIVDRYIALGVNRMRCAEDPGMQHGPMLPRTCFWHTSSPPAAG